MKKCCKCDIDKDLKEFSKCISRKDGFQPRCKLCSKYYRDNDKLNQSKSNKFNG